MIQIVHNPQCSKSNCALELLKDSNLDYEILDYLNTPLSAETLRDIIQKTGLPAEALLRKTEPVFKEKYEGKHFSDEEWIAVMTKHPVLIQRPIVISGDKAVIGRPIEQVYDLIK